MSNVSNPKLYDAFKNAVIDMANDSKNNLDAYKKAKLGNQELDDRSQRKFLNQYAKLTGSPITPIDGKKDRWLTMTGVKFAHDGQEHIIDFDNPDNKPYKDFLNKGFMYAMLYPRAWNKDTQHISIEQDKNAGDNAWTITVADNSYRHDPLSENTAPITMQAIHYLHKKSPEAKITVNSMHFIDITRDEKTGENVFSAFRPDAYDPEYGDTELMRADKNTSPNEMFTVNSISLSRTYSQNSRYITGDREFTETLDLSEYVGDKLDNPEIQEIHEDAERRKAGFITPTEHNLMNQARAEDKNERRNDFFNTLTEYGLRAEDQERGDMILYNNGYTPGAGHEDMVRCLSLLAANVENAKPHEIYNACSANKVKIIGQENLGEAVGSMMRMDITPTKGGNTTRIYPVFDRTNADSYADYSKEPLAIAGVNPKTWEPVGILRMDDPDAKPIYDKMIQSVAVTMGYMGKEAGNVKTAQNARIIPENEKPDFMREDNSPQDDTQYE